jgi:plastocyanin
VPKTSILALAGALVLLAGCGSGTSPTTPPATSAGATTASSPTPAGGGEKLALEANPEGQLKYDKTSLTAKAGKVSIDFTNMSSLGHNVTVESASGATVGATATFQGASKTLSLDLKPGTYKFFCSVPGHRTAGMEGTLTVQ